MAAKQIKAGSVAHCLLFTFSMLLVEAIKTTEHAEMKDSLVQLKASVDALKDGILKAVTNG